MVYIHEYLEKMIIFDWIMLLLSSGWWLKKHIEKYEFVNGKDDIPYIYIVEKNKSHVPNHQPVMV